MLGLSRPGIKQPPKFCPHLNSCWHSAGQNYPLTMNRRFQWSYGGDGEAVRQALSAGRGHTGISHVYRPLSWQTSTRLQWEYRECSIMCFTESRLHEDVLDSVIQNNYILLHLYFFDVLSTLPDMGKIITHVSSKRTRTELLCAPMRRCLSPQSCMSA